MTLKNLNRLHEIQKTLRNETLLIEEPLHLFYLLGLDISAGMLLISSSKAQLFVDGRYLQVCQKKSPIRTVLYSDEEFKKFGPSLYFDADHMTFARVEDLKKLGFTLMPKKDPLLPLMAVKEKGEIEKMRKSIALCRKGYKEIKKHLKVGITEKELALLFSLFTLKHGAILSFDAIIAFGENAALPHHKPTTRRLKKGEGVLIDIGVNMNHYASDMTRTLFFGPPPSFLKEIYDVVEKANKSAIALCKKGEKIGNLDQAARKVIAEHGFDEYFVHSLGHGIGLKTHEYPRLKSGGVNSEDLLQSGMVITIEPGIYLPQKGGVRIEDMVLIKDKSCEILTTGF